MILTIPRSGGAGFIGSYLIYSLLGAGESVTVFDGFGSQVHGETERPRVSARTAHRRADDRDRSALAKEVPRADVVFHLASAVGVGQSPYLMSPYVVVNRYEIRHCGHT